MRPFTETCFSKPTEPFPAEEYTRRLSRLERMLARKKVDAFVIVTEPNRLYLTGFESTRGYLLVSPGRRPLFLTDFRYLEMARGQLGFTKIVPLPLGKKLADVLTPIARRAGWRTMAHENSLTGGGLAELQKAMPSVSEWKEQTKILNDLRAVKSRLEIETMRRAVAMNDLLFSRTMEVVRPGMSEWEIRCLMRAETDRLGQGEAFPSIVCAGANGARCHHHPSLRVLRPNQALLLDHGVLVNGYCSDMTRTVFYGRPNPRIKEIYRIVLHANQAAIAAVSAGRTCADIDGVARRIIEKAGYGTRFGHGLGHSLGIEIHEHPSFGAGNKTVLKPGMLMTVEPGIYLPGVGGVRIEDVILVTRSGCEVLSQSPKRLADAML